jgi:hypothetical protein
MRSLVFLALMGAVAWALLRSMREQRRAWLRRLGLVGKWTGREGSTVFELELGGAPEGGSYEETTRSAGEERVERGSWRVAGETLVFRPDAGGSQRCELRLFAPGRIGLHGPGREQRVYERTVDNVVALPRR